MAQPNKEPQSPQKGEEPPATSEDGTEDYYFENGLMVMTAAYHQKRGVCCGNACRHCPYDHINVTE